jgi:hypothetical protein
MIDVVHIINTTKVYRSEDFWLLKNQRMSKHKISIVRQLEDFEGSLTAPSAHNEHHYRLPSWYQ